MTPYIGITGFSTGGEVAEILQHLPAASDRLLMCGVLLSNALVGRADKWRSRALSAAGQYRRYLF